MEKKNFNQNLMLRKTHSPVCTCTTLTLTLRLHLRLMRGIYWGNLEQGEINTMHRIYRISDIERHNYIPTRISNSFFVRVEGRGSS